jgi:hypothetical protein
MRYLIVVLMLLFPSLVFAAQEAQYTLDCELISGAQCKAKCSESDVMVRQVEIMGGEKQGSVADLDCSKYGKEFKCCVDKSKMKE